MITRKSLAWLGALAVLGITIVLLTVSSIETPNTVRILTRPQDVEASPTPQPPTVQLVIPEATSTVTVAEEAIPLCTFDASAQPAPSTFSLDSYVFSEPKVVLTNTTAIRLLRWLPDNRRLLISRAIEGKFGDYIETFDLETGEITRHSEWWDGQGIPLWLSSEQAVVFVSSAPPDYVRKLYLAHGQGLPVKELATGLATPLLSLGADGQRIIFSSELQGIRSLQFQQTLTSEPLVTNLPGQIEAEWPYLDAWRADGSMVAMYKRGMFYLVDQESETTCEVDLGSTEGQKVWAIETKWSPDGRYVAALVTIGEAPFRSINLMIVDTIAGVQNADLGGQSAQSIDWLPGSNILLVTVDANPDPSLGSFDSLYLVDATTHSSWPILPEHQFFAAGHFGALWSPDGKTISVACSKVVPPDEVVEWRICTATVEAQR